MEQLQQIPLPDSRRFTPAEMERRALDFAGELRLRPTVRQFSSRPVPYQVIHPCLNTASSAPSGANMQPWHLVVVEDPAVKREIRQAAEREERDFYEKRAPHEWLEALRPLGTDWRKPFLQDAPYLIVIFMETYGLDDEGRKTKHYYAQESVGIATGMLLAALHHAGLATLTHTPSPMGFLNEILDRPENE